MEAERLIAELKLKEADLRVERGLSNWVASKVGYDYPWGTIRNNKKIN